MGISDNPHTKYTHSQLEAENRNHNNYVAAYLTELKEEQQVKKDFDQRVQQLIDWVGATIPDLSKTEFDNTLAGAQVRQIVKIGYTKYNFILY